MSYRSFKIFAVSASDCSTVNMRRQFCICTYEFLSMVTEGVIHNVHKVVIQSSFSVIRVHKKVKVLVVSPHGRPAATKGKLRLMQVVSR